MQADAPVVDIQGLTKRFGEFVALNDVSISLDRGQILGIIGPNGAGKTTMIKILVGLAKPSAGAAKIAGVDCTRNARKIKRMVGYMPDVFGSYDNMRVHEYLDFFGAAFGIGRKQRKVRIQEVMETTGSTYMQDRFVETLSHGMRQRIGIARTLLHDPQVLIFDEPANGLDPQARVEMRELLLRLAAMNKTLIVTSHILPELSRICNRCAIITKGNLRAIGTLDEIMEQVNERRSIEIQLLAADQIAATISILEKLVEEDAEIVGSPSEATVRFETNRTEAELCEILSQLVAAEIKVSQFRELQSSLEDAFLSVTKNDEVSENAETIE